MAWKEHKVKQRKRITNCRSVKSAINQKAIKPYALKDVAATPTAPRKERTVSPFQKVDNRKENESEISNCGWRKYL